MLADTLLAPLSAKFPRTIMSRFSWLFCRIGRSCSSRLRLAFTSATTCLAVLLTLSTLAVAQEASNTSPAPRPPSDEVARVHLASDLTEHGLRNEDPFALIAAARLYKGLSGKVLEKGQAGKDGKAVDVDFLLDRASEIAEDDRVKELAQAVKNERTRPPLSPPPCPVYYYEWYCPGFGLSCYYRWVCL